MVYEEEIGEKKRKREVSLELYGEGSERERESGIADRKREAIIFILVFHRSSIIISKSPKYRRI